jgi:omega-6 fatty acid desaturase (delta-12 desaturase)
LPRLRFGLLCGRQRFLVSPDVTTTEISIYRLADCCYGPLARYRWKQSIQDSATESGDNISDLQQHVPPSKTVRTVPVWRETVVRYKQSHLLKSSWQVLNTLPPFFGLWYLMYLSLFQSYWLTLLLAVPTAGFLVRIFIIQHDCGHHSFFRGLRVNDLLGSFCGILTITPYYYWRRTHARHHVTSGNLNHRGQGDVGVLTVEEYAALSRWGRLGYRLQRHPLIMFFLGATLYFVVLQRFTFGTPRSWRRERRSVYLTNLGILAVLGLAWWTVGLTAFFLVHVPVVMIAAAVGSWLFFVQHQYEDAYWEPDQTWDFHQSALEGSSFYRLPRVLQWFTGNIGYHHIHHLNSRIPNYNLPACYDEQPAFRHAVTFGLWESLRCAAMKLWDADNQRMVTFAEAESQMVTDTAVGARRAA